MTLLSSSFPLVSLRRPSEKTRGCLTALVSLFLALTFPSSAGTAPVEEPSLTREEIKQFLLTADIVDSRLVGSGTTEPWRLTLSNGKITHDAIFQSIDMRRDRYTARDGTTELFFVDSYRYNCAAYELAELLGLGEMVPVTVERVWRGDRGSLSWWIDDVQGDGLMLYEKRIEPPDPVAWQHQMDRMRVFGQLIYDTDRNLGNMLFTQDWKLWMVDFSRAFRRWRKLQEPDKLKFCDRDLFQKLRELDKVGVKRATGAYLTDFEIEALMARRDLLIEHFETLVADKGEAAVLY